MTNRRVLALVFFLVISTHAQAQFSQEKIAAEDCINQIGEMLKSKKPLTEVEVDAGKLEAGESFHGLSFGMRGRGSAQGEYIEITDANTSCSVEFDYHELRGGSLQFQATAGSFFELGRNPNSFNYFRQALRYAPRHEVTSHDGWKISLGAKSCQVTNDMIKAELIQLNFDYDIPVMYQNLEIKFRGGEMVSFKTSLHRPRSFFWGTDLHQSMSCQIP